MRSCERDSPVFSHQKESSESNSDARLICDHHALVWSSVSQIEPIWEAPSILEHSEKHRSMSYFSHAETQGSISGTIHTVIGRLSDKAVHLKCKLFKAFSFSMKASCVSVWHQGACENIILSSERRLLIMFCSVSARSAGCMHSRHMMKQSLDRGVVWDLTVDGDATRNEMQDALPEHVHHLITTS